MPRRYILKLPFDLRPFATTIEPGTVLFLRSDAAARSLLNGTGLELGALGHPCVVVGAPRDCGYAKILLTTTFGGRAIDRHIREEYWQEYLPIAPTHNHPTYPGVQLCLQGAPNNAGGYVNVVDCYFVPWIMLTKWVPNAPISQVSFDDTSTEIIIRFMEWATYDLDTTNMPLEQYLALYNPVAFQSRLIHTQHRHQRPRVGKVQPPQSQSSEQTNHDALMLEDAEDAAVIVEEHANSWRSYRTVRILLTAFLGGYLLTALLSTIGHLLFG